jgi:hypothetical protein
MRRLAVLAAITAVLALPTVAVAQVPGPIITEPPTIGTTTTGTCRFDEGTTTCYFTYESVDTWGCNVIDGQAYVIYTTASWVYGYTYRGNVLSGEPLYDFTPLTYLQLAQAGALPQPGVRQHAKLIASDGHHLGLEYPIGYLPVASC